MEKLFAEPLFYIYLVYGLSFLIMSYVVIDRITNATNIALVSSFYLLAFFGLTHGMAEMADWIRLISKFLSISEMGFKYLSQISMIASFFLLLQFGLNLLTYKWDKKNIVRTLPIIFLALLIVFSVMSQKTEILQIGLISRYTFGFVGSVLSAFALYKLARTMKPLGNRKLNLGLTVNALGFALYAVFGGLIIQPIAGFPIQLFRAACAVIITISTFVALDVFAVE